MDYFVDVRELMSDVFQIPEEEITRTTSQRDLENWDSLAHLNFMLSLEEKFELNLDVEDLKSLISVPAILIYLESKQRVF
jgi:acyl carrier protein